MKKAIRVNTKKKAPERGKAETRGRKKTTGPGTLLGVRVQPPMLAALDTWIGEQPGRKPTRPEAVRALVRDALIHCGILKPDAPE